MKFFEAIERLEVCTSMIDDEWFNPSAKDNGRRLLLQLDGWVHENARMSNLIAVLAGEGNGKFSAADVATTTGTILLWAVKLYIEDIKSRIKKEEGDKA